MTKLSLGMVISLYEIISVGIAVASADFPEKTQRVRDFI
jgi:hypothetical protein